MMTSASGKSSETKWAVLAYYQCFENAFVLTLVIGLIILVALYRLAST